MPYPYLTAMIHDLSYDNAMRCFELPEVDWSWPGNAPELERMASLLSDADRNTFIFSDESEVDAVVEKYKLQALATFFEDVFQGDLHFNFYRPLDWYPVHWTLAEKAS